MAKSRKWALENRIVLVVRQQAPSDLIAIETEVHLEENEQEHLPSSTVGNLVDVAEIAHLREDDPGHHRDEIDHR